MSSPVTPLPLFAGYGIELEYMIVSAGTRSVLPLADRLLPTGLEEDGASDPEGEMDWSNELASHVIELKTKGPAPSLDGVADKAVADIRGLNGALASLGACLMPTAMHPWMDPATETVLWPHDYSEVYQAFNRVFGCQGHGWSNLQSMHINLPFATDEEFGRLHAAIRLVLPLLPGLAASSPIQDGRPTGYLDSRLRAYRTNCRRVPSVTGLMVPEPVFTPAEYRLHILDRMYRDISPLDPEGVLQEEWLNARGAIGRFERNTIEIRLLDIQETPRADLAIAAVTVAVLKALVRERWMDWAVQKTFSTESLASMLESAIQEADRAVVTDHRYLSAFGIDSSDRLTVGEIWEHLIGATLPASEPANQSWLAPLKIIIGEGCLSRRILRATGPAPDRKRLREIYAELCGCLAEDRLFRP